MWSAAFDEDSGRVYFVKGSGTNRRTSWSAPEDAPSNVIELSKWVKAVDESSGKHYWYNSLSGASSWADPIAALKSKVHDYDTTSRNADKTPTWDTHVDPDTESVYYVHKVTGVSQWELPEGNWVRCMCLTLPLCVSKMRSSLVLRACHNRKVSWTQRRQGIFHS